MNGDSSSSPTGTKRKFEDAAEDLADEPLPDEEEEEEEVASTGRNLALKVNPDGTVEQEDTVRYVE